MNQPLELDTHAEPVWSRFKSAGQEHVFRFWDELDDDHRASFLQQLESVDLEQMKRLAALANDSGDRPGATLEPAPVVRLDESPQGCTRDEAIARGEKLLRDGQVGIYLVAGGQGSRLGFDGPKGSLPFGTLSERSLFELHAQKIHAMSERHGKSLPWYIMTSPANNAQTVEFFEKHDFFGLSPLDVLFCPQDMLPAVDGDGHLILRDRANLFLSPNGHGGAYGTLAKCGGVEDARRRGIEHLFFFQVDNALVRIADPLFLGLHDLTAAEMSLKVLEKTGPTEKIGVVGLRDGVPEVIEYSDLPDELATARDDDGRLVFGAGSIAMHAFRVDFFDRVASGDIDLPYHIANKNIVSIDRDGNPCQVEGRKFETFVFDALRATERFLHLEVVREQEFAPVKSATGVDSLDSARDLVMAEHRRWLAIADVKVNGRLEIGPSAALGADDLETGLDAWSGTTIDGDVRIERDADGRLTVEVVG